MAVIIPQVVTEDRASGALVIDGSLKFDNDNTQYLTRTPGTAGNRNVWTWSGWVKKTNATEQCAMFSAYGSGSNAGYGMLWFQNNGILYFHNWDGQNNSAQTDATFRDTGWYHVVAVHDENQVSSEKMRFWVNGTEQSLAYNLTGSTAINDTIEHRIGMEVYNSRKPYDGSMSQITFVDGLAIGPEYFGYTDPLTNTWRPKKFKAEGTTFNDGRVFSSNVTGANNPTNGFNGSLANYMVNSAGVTPMILTATFRNVHSFRYYTSNSSAHDVSFNGGTAYRDAPGTGWRTIPNPPSTITSISWIHSNTAATAQVEAVEINGEILLDSTTRNLAFGTNGFYLPLDGNSPIGQDKSGNGNDWTPVNFSGSTDITKATGALPILNTLGGTVARTGVFGSEVSKYYTILGTSGGGNPYVFEDLGNQPQLSFIRGATYTFDWSAASSHPLRFATAADAAGSTEYTDGTDVTGNVTTITVPHNAPDTLYYYCNVHGGMGNSISVTTDETKADPYAWKCVLAVPFAGSANDVSASINCTTSNHAATVSGSVASSARSNFYNNSFFFDGTDDTVYYAHSEDFHIGASDFTVEGWVWKDNKGSRQSWIGQRDGGSTEWRILFDYLANPDADSEGAVRMEWGSSQLVFTSNALKHSQWNHVAMVRSGTTGTLYINGISIGTQTLSNIGDYAADLYIGQQINTGGENYQGYMNDIRIYKGVAKYTSSVIGEQVFIPASTSPDILPDTPSGVGTKTQLTKITDGAVSFDGSNDYLSVPATDEFTFGTGDFTIETFVYHNTLGASGNVIIDFRDAPNNTDAGALWMTSGNEFGWYVNGSNRVTGATVASHKWYHVALVRNSGTTSLYVDGISVGSFSDSYSYATKSGRAHIGELSDGSGSLLLDGFISNLRVIKGTALYTSNFTPPTRALTNVTNTKLLGCQSNTEPGRAAVAPSISGANNGTNWSHYVTGDIDSSFPAWRAFRNDTTSVGCRTQTATGATIVWQPPSPIAFSSTFKIWAALDGTSYGNTFTVTHAGGTTDFTSSVATGTTQTELDLAQVAGVTSPITKITITSGGSNPRFSGIEVDSTMLVDPLSPRGSTSATNFNSFTTDINTVRGQETGYATLNPLISTVSLSDGNLKQAQTSGTWNVAVSSIPMSTGKWYCEVTLLGGNTFQMGIIKLDDGPNWVANFPLVDFPYGWGMVVDSVAKLRSDYITQLNGRTDVEYNSTAPVAGDTIGMAYNADTQALTFYVNGISYGDTTSYWSYPPTAGEYVFGNSVVTGTDALWNFGQKPFKFTPPDGFQPLTSSAARPDTVISRSDQYFDVSLWTGNGTSQTITGLKHKPDLVWTKARSFGADPELYDSVRGTMKRLYSSLTTQEGTASSGVNSFNADGFGVTGGGGVNNSTSTYVGWSWKAGGNKNTFNIDDVGYANASDVNMSVGALNSTAYNTSQDWSNSSNTSGSVNTSGNYTPANMFNGILGNESVSGAVCFSTYASNASMTWTSPVPLTNLTSLRLYVDKSGSNDGFLRVNGHNYDGWVTSGSFTDGWITIPETYLETIQFGYTGGVNTATGIAGVEVNGQLLIDSGNSPANIPSIAATGSSVGTKQGFSIVKYTGSNTGGSTLAHGLGQIPDFVICKNLGTSYNWFIWHNEFGNGENAGIYFTDAGKTTGYGTQPFLSLTEHAITLNNNDGVNGNYDYIMYAWHNVPGFQKFGSYESNSNGVFVELGFRPALLVVKNADATLTNSQWNVVDTQRDTYNPSLNNLAWNRSNSEPAVSASTYGIDILSNGFAIPSGNTGEAINNVTSTQTYIYAAWAEAPAFNLYGATSNAR